ncbi:CPBP family intramembrane glutamic endopeptidase [Lentilactobacillus fungorum]|uniref:CPBP family intramembrane glutamic endopeptidase n=1 Tax=Lentilactobacillus fungorum TaxID=2201250 RepID=UPI0019425762|nr:CPBP family intramembrane glutamic endopeptidase [Lentilactobacillus fungorum]
MDYDKYGVFGLKEYMSNFTKNKGIRLLSFIIIEKALENGVLVPLILKTSLSDYIGNLVYKSVEVLLVCILNILLTRQCINLKIKLTAKTGAWLLIMILCLVPFMNFKPINNFLRALVWTLLVAIAEELLFRGVILKDLLNLLIRSGHLKSHGVFIAITISSLLFSVEHLTNITNQSGVATICQMIQTFGMGTLFAALYIRTGSLFYPISLHFLIDFPSLYFAQSYLAKPSVA